MALEPSERVTLSVV